MQGESTDGLDAEPSIDAFLWPTGELADTTRRQHAAHRIIATLAGGMSLGKVSETGRVMHIAGSGPSALASGLLSNTLTTKRIDKVRYFDPQISNRNRVGVAGRLVEHGDLDFVRLVDDDLKVLLPPVRLAGMRPRALRSFDFERDEGVGDDAGGAPT